MTNDSPVVIGWQGNKFLKDANSKAFSLYQPNGLLNDSNYTSFYSSETSAVYQVPADKAYVILQITLVGASDSAFQKNMMLGYSTTQDSSTGFTKVQHWQSSVMNPYTYECYISIPTGNYITGFGEANSGNLILSGVEIDA